MTQTKHAVAVGVTGHRFLSRDASDIAACKKGVMSALTFLAEANSVTLHCCFALGADILAAECANSLDIPVVAHIPMPPKEYLNDIKRDALSHGMPFSAEDENNIRRLLSLAKECHVAIDPVDTYAAASLAVLECSDKLIVVWDGVKTPLFDADGKPINRGGTYSTLTLAKSMGFTDDDIFIVTCRRA